jgi:hypothetical protein
MVVPKLSCLTYIFVIYLIIQFIDCLPCAHTVYPAPHKAKITTRILPGAKGKKVVGYTHKLKLMNYLFLEFSSKYFWTQLTMGNYNHRN